MPPDEIGSIGSKGRNSSSQSYRTGIASTRHSVAATDFGYDQIFSNFEGQNLLFVNLCLRKKVSIAGEAGENEAEVTRPNILDSLIYQDFYGFQSDLIRISQAEVIEEGAGSGHVVSWKILKQSRRCQESVQAQRTGQSCDIFCIQTFSKFQKWQQILRFWHVSKFYTLRSLGSWFGCEFGHVLHRFTVEETSSAPRETEVPWLRTKSCLTSRIVTSWTGRSYLQERFQDGNTLETAILWPFCGHLMFVSCHVRKIFSWWLIDEYWWPMMEMMIDLNLFFDVSWLCAD